MYRIILEKSKDGFVSDYHVWDMMHGSDAEDVCHGIAKQLGLDADSYHRWESNDGSQFVQLTIDEVELKTSSDIYSDVDRLV